ncbi:hypothetical protein H112_03975 [Trichophyton rubrum D6]|nr:hypothetical protein H100_03982 [Trichophyton rubrum MR850]EZF42394.1 hypothetical protein H102_03968 [Trichophyton rubrum CBS 100081]EZF53059.1 hypothetical protein H103_03982 [Trichophyton rubrum CBS 288.86]EZF63698.1 hypothetical protein H104_03968 [Trichophyton rubrum CBS 289.86]EZF74303.1 hypothetical protein H105_03997 [Trichophyton soudanense CBS 452.61]EZF84977.1 hypothetical protein H110_03975 [Trichophyton rubrum MR1448]EZF95726.1 hypothetical protein H113_04008 [Trichophyton rub
MAARRPAPGETLVHFFDINSEAPGKSRSWSPNTLPIRAVLNYKMAPYTQTYVAMPDIEPLLKSLHVPPLAGGRVPYTLPAILHKPSIQNEGATLNDSFALAVHLETIFPPEAGYKSIFPNGQCSYALAVAVLKVFRSIFPPVLPFCYPAVPKYLDERSREYFYASRKQMLGMTMDEFEAKGEALEEAWKATEAEIAVLVKMLKGRPSPRKNRGPFFEGEHPGYADMVLLGFMGWFQKNSQADLDRLLKLGDGELQKVWDAGHQWLEAEGENVEYEIPK